MKPFGFRFRLPELALSDETSLSVFSEFDAAFFSISKIQENLGFDDLRN